MTYEQAGKTDVRAWVLQTTKALNSPLLTALSTTTPMALSTVETAAKNRSALNANFQAFLRTTSASIKPMSLREVPTNLKPYNDSSIAMK